MKLRVAIQYVVARIDLAIRWSWLRRVDPGDCPDSLDPSMIPTVQLGDSGNRVLADVDQDGYLFARDERDKPLFNARKSMSPRERHEVQVVLSNGVVRLRKRCLKGLGRSLKEAVLDALQLEFFLEAAALVRLRGLPCVPTVWRIDKRHQTIEMDYIWGLDVRQLLAEHADNIDYDLVATKFERALKVGGMATEIRQALRKVMKRGVIPRDFHAANVIQGRTTGRLYLVDFNVVSLRPVPGWRTYRQAVDGPLS